MSTPAAIRGGRLLTSIVPGDVILVALQSWAGVTLHECKVIEMGAVRPLRPPYVVVEWLGPPAVGRKTGLLYRVLTTSCRALE